MKGGFHLPVLKYDQGTAGAVHDLGPGWHLRSELCIRQTPTAGDGGRDASGATTFPVVRLARAVSCIQLLKSLLSLSLASFWFSAPRNSLWRPLSFREPVDAQRQK